RAQLHPPVRRLGDERPDALDVLVLEAPGGCRVGALVQLAAETAVRGLVKGRAKVGQHAVDVDSQSERHQLVRAGPTRAGTWMVMAARTAASAASAGVVKPVSNKLCTAAPSSPHAAPSRTQYIPDRSLERQRHAARPKTIRPATTGRPTRRPPSAASW